MQTLAKILAVAVAAVVSLSATDPSWAKQKKPRAKKASSSGLVVDSDGTPIIMQGYRKPAQPKSTQPSIMRDEPGVKADTEKADTKQASRPRPRGSSTYIPPSVPSRSGSPAIVSPNPGVYKPPAINSFGDRTTGCIHSFPLNAGIGNNPSDQQSYIRQCAN